MREEILKTNPTMSMPEVAKACSEKYAKLTEKKKAKYKARCDEMRKQYEQKLANFFREHPDLKPVKAPKAAKIKMNNNAQQPQQPIQFQPQQPMQAMQQPMGAMQQPIQHQQPHQHHMVPVQPPQTIVATMTGPSQV